MASNDGILSFGFTSVNQHSDTEERLHDFNTRRRSLQASAPPSLALSPSGPSSARLVLSDGSEISGFSFGAPKSVSGEVVFNTGMVGYPESLSDPSYKGQILVLTYPLIGNYGVPDRVPQDEFGLAKYFESEFVHVSALVISAYTGEHSHWNAASSLGDWLKEHDVPAIYGVDTRALTKRIRDAGSMLGKIVYGDTPSESVPFEDPNARNLVAEVSRTEVEVFGSGPTRIVAVDLGIKNNIIRYLARSDVTLTVVPWDYDFNADSESVFDGIFLSNGPGNPESCTRTIEHIKEAMRRQTPIFGICMGHQLLALAAGASSYKMKFGNRGMNQPCIDLRTTLCYITPQNHGYAIDDTTLPDDWAPFFRNANDHSNEGIIHTHKPFFSVQFHPEAQGGPNDTAFLFDMFMSRVRDKRTFITTVSLKPTSDPIRRVLLLGSGGLSIGQAGEFDYSGSQAIKAMKEENIEVVLVNSNIATVQTSAEMADRVYFLPVTPEFVAQLIRKERPDGILLQFGGQTALNCGISLYDSGVLAEYNVRVLGTPVETIRMTEDREMFARTLDEIHEHSAPSATATTLQQALDAAQRIGYPVLVRSAFALGGLGSGFADNEASMRKLVLQAFASSSQIIIDKSLRGWKEVEYEVVRDCKNNCITVCNMENFDPLGIHTGDSIVVAPSQTLSNDEYYRLRSTAIKVVRHLGIVGECNIQYALNPNSNEYCIIEVNARLSRSSALASKATGYPLAYVAAKLALDMTLTEIKNSVTKKTTACFEPSLDYVVVKIPRWDLRKFFRVSNEIGSAMKSIGEVMAIGRSFEEAFQKGLRMVDGSIDGFGDPQALSSEQQQITREELERSLQEPSDQRVFFLAMALKRRYPIERIHELTRIDRWFLSKLYNIIQLESTLSGLDSLWKFPARLVLEAKQCGFSDLQIGRCSSASELEVRKLRQQLGIRPFVKQIDTLAAEFPAYTNYLYMTYNGSEHDLEFEDRGVIVLGCGAYRIGSSCEFDWCAVSCLRTLRSIGIRSIMVNYNPETVSTDYDECDRLYFEELSFERVLDIYETETSSGVVISVGGQIPNNMAMPLYRQGVRILGTPPRSVDNAEDRFKFSALLDSIGVDQPEWRELTTMQDALSFAESIGYPCLVRPSYVLSGAAMNVAYSPDDLQEFLSEAACVSSDAPVVMSKFIERAKEIELDGVALHGRILNFAVSEHVENAGVHSGDATLVLPAQKLYTETLRLVKKTASMIAESLNITGPFNIQFLSKDNEIKVIECNLRASRSFPFVSKTLNCNLIEQATKAMVGVAVKPIAIDLAAIEYVCIKVPMFSFGRLAGADPALRVEMSSTGEVACFGDDRHEAYLKGLIATGFKVPKKTVLVSTGPLEAKIEFISSALILHELGFDIYATRGTHSFLCEHNVPCKLVEKPSSGVSPNAVSLISDGVIDMVVNVPDTCSREELTDGYRIRRAAVDFSVGLITNIKSAVLLVAALKKVKKFSLKSWRDYLREGERL